MITIDQLNKLQGYGISLGLLKLLLATEDASRIDDIVDETGLARRSIEKLVNRRRELLNRFYSHETPVQCLTRTVFLIDSSQYQERHTMICKKSARICKEWAADFRQTGDMEESGFWVSMSFAFKSGDMQVLGDGLSDAINYLMIAKDNHKLLRDTLVALHGKAGSQCLDELEIERDFMLEKLATLQKAQTLN